MALVGTALISRITSKNAAERAFQPWWDTAEDYLVYGLIMLGLVSMPTTMFAATPLDCNICKTELNNCQAFLNDTGFFPWNNSGDPFSRFWVKKYCTLHTVHDFILYFPYVLIVFPLCMYSVERGFVKIFKGNVKAEALYNQLVAPGETSVLNFVESRKSVIELGQKFRKTNNFYRSYMYRAIMQVFLALGMFIICASGLKKSSDDWDIHCVVYGVSYECTGHPIKFYYMLIILAMFFLAIYASCASYCFLWLWGPTAITSNSLSKVMYRYRDESPESKSVEGGLTRYYYDNADLRLLLDLLAVSHGLAASLRVLALFDTEFNTELKVSDIIFPNLPPKIEKRTTTKNQISFDGKTCVEQEEERYDLDITFHNAPANETLFKHMSDMFFIYTIELSPPTTKTSIIPVENESNTKDSHVVELEGNKAGTLERKCSSGIWKKVGASHILEDLDPTKEYTVQVNTVVNGITLANRTESFGPITGTKQPSQEE